MENLIRETIEYQNWGWNMATVSFFATLFFTLWQGLSLLQQNSTIRNKRSGEALSVSFFAYSGSYFFAFLVYGLTKHSIAMTFNGLLGMPYIPILFALHRYKGFESADWFAILFFPLMVPTIILLEESGRDLFVLCGLFFILIPLIGQTWGMYKTKNVGAVEPKFLKAFMASGIFWFAYGLSGGGWIFVVFNPISFVVLGTALTLYHRYNKTAY